MRCPVRAAQSSAVNGVTGFAVKRTSARCSPSSSAYSSATQYTSSVTTTATVSAAVTMAP
ncbi:hypothetical protein [Amycolatopsis sp. DSM 110486]|uniref:hypothetical protein n=1 Tax=Amycolatopsis sp. DSM 110486 TaxID=2865832 RepID=UPI001C69C7A0|nr:hypothetical protein [Amycolatopsis sp. DSM 110486]QYN23015.1 hypothetical protein K1T34_11405 [Amycolatopsis sp. DSM 110486]